MNLKITEPKKIVWWGIAAMAFLLIIHTCKFGVKFWTSSHQDWGVFGDFFGGTLNGVFGFLTIYLVYLNLKSDKVEKEKESELEEYYKILNSHRDVFKNIVVNEIRGDSWFRISGSEAVFSIINENFNNQVMNRVRLRLIGRYNLLIPRLSPEIRSKYISIISGISDMNLRGRLLGNGDAGLIEFFGEHDPLALAQNFGLRLYSEMCEISISCLPFNENIEVLQEAFEQFYQERGYLFGHYIRNHFYLLEYIDGLKQNDKSKMAKFARSFLSSSEVIILFYNCFYKLSTKKYRNLILKYNILDDLNIQPFLHSEFYRNNTSDILIWIKK